MDETLARSTSHLTRLCRYLLGGGVAALIVSTALQWEQLDGGIGDGYEGVLVAQLLMVLGTVALTGAVFGYVLLAVRRDRETSGVDAGQDWYE